MYSELTGVVFDLGSSSLRAGYGGEDNPKFVFPSIAGTIDDSLEMELEDISRVKRILVGEKATRIRKDNLEISDITWNGVYKNWDAFEALLKETYASQMQISPENFPLIMSESSSTESTSKLDSSQRMKICEMIFETMKIQNFYMCKNSVLSSFASGRSTSLVIDSGASSTVVVPIHDGYALKKNTLKVELGGEALTEKVLKYIEEKKNTPIIPRYGLNWKVDQEGKKSLAGYVDFPNTTKSFEKYCKMEIVRDIKESVCRIAVDKGEEGINEKIDYELPDGNIISFSQERFDIPECLFTVTGKKEFKDVDNYSFKGIHNFALDSINKCDIDIRKDLLSNIIVCGGNTLIPGLVERLQKKIMETAPQNARLKLIAYPSSAERKFSSWIGGSILSSLGSFQSLWINKAEYDENGSYIVEKKCP